MAKDKDMREKILNRLEGKSNVKLGECPFCNSDNYERSVRNYEEDFVSMDCTCNNCDKSFTEYFGLDEVSFNKEDESFCYNKNLCKDEKEIIKEWAEEQLMFGSLTEEYRDKLLRISNVMGEGLNSE